MAPLREEHRDDIRERFREQIFLKIYWNIYFQTRACLQAAQPPASFLQYYLKEWHMWACGALVIAAFHGIHFAFDVSSAYTLRKSEIILFASL